MKYWIGTALPGREEVEEEEKYPERKRRVSAERGCGGDHKSWQVSGAVPLQILHHISPDLNIVYLERSER